MRTPRTALVDTTEYLAEPLGPAATAHLRVTRPGEPVLWAAYARAHYYDLPGHDEKGQRQKNVLVRGVGGVLGGLVDAAIGSDEGPDRPPPADVIVFGPGPDCLAHRYLPPGPHRRQPRLSAELLGRAIPPRPVLRLDFTDGSVLWLRDPAAARQAAV